MKPLYALLLAPMLIAAAPKWNRDQQAIIDHGNAWSALYEAGKVDEMRTLYEGDAWLMTQGAPLARGVDAILTFLRRNKERGYAVRFATDPEEIVIDGRYAFLTAKYWMTITPPGRDGIDLAGRSILIFKRGKDRKWRIWRDMDNMAPDVRKEDRPK
jgi:ketosteroid isomerase-like protein